MSFFWLEAIVLVLLCFERCRSSYDLQLYLSKKIDIYQNNSQKVTPLAVYGNNWIAFNIIKKIIAYYDNNTIGCCVEKKNKRLGARFLKSYQY